jgi:hypothetical protein
MSLTVTQQQTLVAQLLTDTSNTKWTNAAHILPQLNAAQEEFVTKVISFTSQNRRAFELLSELQATKSASVASVASGGYALSGVDSTPGPFMRNGLIAASVTVDDVTRWCQIISAADLNTQRNRYTQGNDERPLCYIFNETFYLLVSSGSYPVTTTLYYIREPKELVAAGASGYQVTTCELAGIYHRIICEIAAANCWRLLGDEASLNKYDRMMARINDKFKTLIPANIVGEPVQEAEV